MIIELFEHNQTAYNTANDTLNLIGKYESIICKKQREKANSQCHLDKDCFIVRNSYTADKHFVYLLYFYLITLLT